MHVNGSAIGNNAIAIITTADNGDVTLSIHEGADLRTVGKRLGCVQVTSDGMGRLSRLAGDTEAKMDER